METVEARVKLHRAQQAFRRSDALYRGFVGGRGCGKTWVGAYDLIRRAKADRTYLVGSPTGILMQDTTFPTFKAIAQQLGRWDAGQIRLTPYPTIILSTGATIRFRTAEDPERMRGPNLSGIWLDEASLMDVEAFRVCIACLREAGEQGWLSATMTPKGLSHWTFDQFGKQKPDTAIFHAATRDNPFLPRDFHHTLAQQYSGLRAQQELEGLFVNVEGAEWPAEYFSDDLWFTDWPTHFIAKAIALDPSKGRDASKPKEGRPPDYSAYVLASVDAQGVVWVDADLSNTRDVTQMVQDGIGLYRQFQPQAVLVEVNQFQELIGGEFQRIGNELRLHLPLYGINNTEPKPVRIRTIGPYLAKRELRFRDTPGCRLLVQQLRDFPCGSHDDGPDSLSMALRMLLYLILGRQEGQGQPRLLRS